MDTPTETTRCARALVGSNNYSSLTLPPRPRVRLHRNGGERHSHHLRQIAVGPGLDACCRSKCEALWRRNPGPKPNRCLRFPDTSVTIVSVTLLQ